MGSAGGAAAANVYMKQRKRREKGEKIDKASVRRWECVQLSHHKDIGREVEKWESDGWMLYTYTCAQFQSTAVNHYLLFMKEE